jgi:D-tyrosyl-tRNA(Tyr) deacylase
MIAVLQRVRRASVTVEGASLGRIERGLVALVGCEVGDGEAEARTLARKTVELRIFEDPQGKMNLSVTDVGGSVLAISQFTLLGDTRKGRRPSFVRAAPADVAEPLYESYLREMRARGVRAETGTFGARMLVEIENDGPVTVIVEARPKAPA